MKQTGQTRVMDMSLCECMKKKLQQATCDKIDWNRKILKWRKCFKEAYFVYSLVTSAKSI